MRGTHDSKRMLGSSVAWLALAALIGSGSAARAEGFFDVYMGAAFPEESHVHTSSNDAIVDGMIRYNSDVEWETSPSAGVRGGYWIETWPSILGIGLDLSYY